MLWNQIESNWDKLKGAVQQGLKKLSNSDLALIGGKSTELISRIKHVYGVAKEDASKQFEEFRNSLKDTNRNNVKGGAST